ncbi:MAG: hypothetical protein NVV59_14490 [Chitinophagaceae bacterium]|nr:hypothetical protein [Chitinophagaceae bacterium]
MINGFLGEYNYSVDEFISANKGDIVFALTNVGLAQDSIAYEGLNGKKEYFVNSKPDLSFVTGVSVDNKEAFGKMISIIQQQTKGVDRANPDVEYTLSDDWFIVSNEKSSVDAFKAGNNKPVYADKITGHQSGFFVDLQTILTKTKEFRKESGKTIDAADSAIFDASMALWENIIIHGDFKDGKTISVVEVNMLDKNTNSLKQLNKYADVMYKNNRSRYTPDSWEKKKTVLRSPTLINNLNGF